MRCQRCAQRVDWTDDGLPKCFDCDDGRDAVGQILRPKSPESNEWPAFQAVRGMNYRSTFIFPSDERWLKSLA